MAGQVLGVDLDDGEVGQLVGADELGSEDAAVIEGDAHLDGAVDDVVVGDDVAIGRDDDAAADAVLDLRLRGGLHAPRARAEELREARGQTCPACLILIVRGSIVRQIRAR